MNKKFLWPFALTTIALMLNGCGGGSSTINENTGVGDNTPPKSSLGCTATDDTCLNFILDYPVEGLNFDCSMSPNQRYITLLEVDPKTNKKLNAVTGACSISSSKSDETVSLYLQGNNTHKIALGTIKLDTLGKYGATHLTVLDMATALIGQPPASMSNVDPTIKVAMGLVKLFQSIGIERGDNMVGDLQPTQFTQDKKNLLKSLSQDITAAEWKNGQYATLLKPWLDVSKVSDAQAYALVVQVTNLANAALFQATEATYAGFADPVNSPLPLGFYGCNQALADCFNKSTSNLRHMMANIFMLTDREGYAIGYGLQWRGDATLYRDKNGNVTGVAPPVLLWTKVKPLQMVVAAQQNGWLNPISKNIQSTQPLRLSVDSNVNNDLQIYQGKFINDYAVAGSEGFYKQLMRSTTGNTQHYGLWRQTVDTESYKGSLDIIKVNPISYLGKDIFKTAANVSSGQRYIFPLYATLTFSFDTIGIAPIDLGIVIDEKGNIRTDIKPNATATDMSGQCATISDNSLIDSNGVQQYRLGTTGGTQSSDNDSSIPVRIILSNPQLGNLNGILIGLNTVIKQDSNPNDNINDSISVNGAKINLYNLLAGQNSSDSINLRDYENKTAHWVNLYAYYQAVYNNIKDISPVPTDAEKALAQRMKGTVTIKLADQSIPACKAIKIKS
ncbi:protein FilF [Acinetobacter baumannii]|uniref:putative pilus system protein FilF n=1 Tax=Acinetobacter baumannii TaxID=470 RepID=UPI001D57189D|nr:protein FilF [Acinetobacter baumannii]EHU1358760.1 protein FilF [Acinetobacter baumannii]EHU3216999.1 protein FilF [Acinetobacter baumannii]MDC4300420.1 protein FilF [Acinetobacter baumannii]MDC4479786.1 protein FilF [Acinetobacter baumannii]MDC4505195.1 protein FilF [Acinetobacter baumannii]